MKTSFNAYTSWTYQSGTISYSSVYLSWFNLSIKISLSPRHDVAPAINWKSYQLPGLYIFCLSYEFFPWSHKAEARIICHLSIFWRSPSLIWCYFLAIILFLDETNLFPLVLHHISSYDYLSLSTNINITHNYGEALIEYFHSNSDTH